VVNSLRVLLANGALLGGGAEQVVATLARRLREAGHQVGIAVINGGGGVENELLSEGFEVCRYGARRRRFSVLSMSTWLNDVVAERRPHIVHTHDSSSLAVAGTSRIRTRGFRHMHTFHFGNYPHVPAKQLWLERLFARIPDQLVAVGNVQRAALIAALKVPARRVKTIWNGVEPANVGLAGVEAPSIDDVPVVGSVSTFFPQKGLPTLLQAASLVRSEGVRFRLVLVGDGPLRSELEAQVADLNLTEVVTFAGWLPDARRRLPTFDLFVQSSYWEAMSVVILEAMAAGRAILATAVGENSVVLTHEETAILVPPRDAVALAAGMKRLIEDSALRRRLGRAALESSRTEFTASVMAARYIAAYQELCAGGRSGAAPPRRVA
jgi:glycosyltransferase involved in cell wall biosynthesis